MLVLQVARLWHFNYRGQILAKAYREYFLELSEQGCLEINPLVVWEQLADCIKDVNSKIREDPAKALAISTLGEAVVPISKSGEVLANSQVSLDARNAIERDWWNGPLMQSVYMQLPVNHCTPCTLLIKSFGCD